MWVVGLERQTEGLWVMVLERERGGRDIGDKGPRERDKEIGVISLEREGDRLKVRGLERDKSRVLETNID